MKANKIRILIALLWAALVFSNIMAFKNNIDLMHGGILIVNIAVLLISVRSFDFFKMKLYVYQDGEYHRVIGPKEVLDSIGGFGGHIVIGDRFEVGAVYFVGRNNVSNRSINGVPINKMEFKPIDDDDEKELGINIEER